MGLYLRIMAVYSNGKRLAWKASVAGNCDGGSNPFTAV